MQSPFTIGNLLEYETRYQIEGLLTADSFVIFTFTKIRSVRDNMYACKIQLRHFQWRIPRILNYAAYGCSYYQARRMKQVTKSASV
jgi:hypothetical protein